MELIVDDHYVYFERDSLTSYAWATICLTQLLAAIASMDSSVSVNNLYTNIYNTCVEARLPPHRAVR